MKSEFKASDVARDLTMSVTIIGLKAFRCRLWFSVQLIKLAGWVSNMRVEINA